MQRSDPPRDSIEVRIEKSAPRVRVVYLVLLVGALLIAGAREMLLHQIFACPGSGYGSERYLAYCQASLYGDYDHGAFWFRLEPEAMPHLRNAQVLFLGNSRLEWAFSNPVTAQWFGAHHTTYYLFGFAYSETYVFEQALLRTLGPRARVYVINLDSFFGSRPSPPAQFVMEDGSAWRRYEGKKAWQRVHRVICGAAAAICGHEIAFFRSRSTGSFSGSPGPPRRMPVSADAAGDDAPVKEQVANAIEFLSHAPVSRDCVILTLVPSTKTNYNLASRIAAQMGAPFIAPNIANLYTVDGSHLDEDSARRWAAAFLRAAGPRIQQCLTPTLEVAGAVSAHSE
jgi:hypothetical protein